MKVLFICSRNQWRSPTAERVFEREPGLEVRSRGTSRGARRSVTSEDLKWADLVFVMESKHRQRLLADYPGEMRYKRLHVLAIPDEYRFMDPELVDLLELSIRPVLENGENGVVERKP